MGKGTIEVRSASEVVAYLVEAYAVSEEEALAACITPEGAKHVLDAAMYRSFAYYPGDKIASAQGWPEREGYDPDADDDYDW